MPRFVDIFDIDTQLALVSFESILDRASPGPCMFVEVFWLKKISLKTSSLKNTRLPTFAYFIGSQTQSKYFELFVLWVDGPTHFTEQSQLLNESRVWSNKTSLRLHSKMVVNSHILVRNGLTKIIIMTFVLENEIVFTIFILQLTYNIFERSKISYLHIFLILPILPSSFLFFSLIFFSLGNMSALPACVITQTYRSNAGVNVDLYFFIMYAITIAALRLTPKQLQET